jgi:putative aldouronate transport system permease protein
MAHFETTSTPAVNPRVTTGRRRKPFDWSQLLLGALLLIVAMITLYPFLYAVAFSFSSANRVAVENVLLFPVGPTLDNYRSIFRMQRIYSAAGISVFRTVVGVLWACVITGLAAWALTRKDMPGNKLIALLLLIPMYISGGLIPSYTLTYQLGLFNNLLVYILPNGFYAFNMLLMRTYFDTLPRELEESARIDGAGELTIFFKLILPLSMPIFAVIAMFVGVWQWNAWFDAQLYVTNPLLKPLQNVLQSLIREASVDLQSIMTGRVQQRTVSPETIRMTMLVITTVPIMFVYPFFQKHFVRGVLIGAVKA